MSRCVAPPGSASVPSFSLNLIKTDRELTRTIIIRPDFNIQPLLSPAFPFAISYSTSFYRRRDVYWGIFNLNLDRCSMLPSIIDHLTDIITKLHVLYFPRFKAGKFFYLRTGMLYFFSVDPTRKSWLPRTKENGRR